MHDLDPWIRQQKAEYFELPLDDGHFVYYPNFLTAQSAQLLFEQLYQNTPWRCDKVRVFGKWYDQPRQTAWYATTPRKYSYSGLELDSLPITKPLQSLLDSIQEKTNARFNSVLLNLYRDGNDSNGWHSDDEKEMGTDPIIASLSLGGSRIFQLKHKASGKSYKLSLSPGSLLWMGTGSQINWKHQLPKTKKPVEPRINGTFRCILETP